MQHLNIRVIGEVQGVFFRISTKVYADKLELKGFVTNLADGSVFIEVEGAKKSLEKFIEWCHHGPELAKVGKVEVKPGLLKNFRDFNITYGS